MKRFLIKLTIFVVLSLLSVWGYHTLDGQGTITRIIAETPIYHLLDSSGQNDIKNKMKNLYGENDDDLDDDGKNLIGVNDYKKPDITIPIDAYEHTNALNHGKYLLKNVTNKIVTKTDSKGRLISIAKRISKTSNIMTLKNTDTDYNPRKIILVNLFGSSEVTNLTEYIYDEAISKYNTSIADFLLANNQDVIMQINFSYKQAKDKMPYLINYKAFSAGDYGKKLNINVDFYNHTPKYKIDYAKFKSERIYKEVN